jgi:PAS domain S-box-containing protein
VGNLLPRGSSRDSLGGVLERLASAFAAQAALVIAPGSVQPLGEEAAYPRDILDDPVLLAQVRSAWATHGSEAVASGRPFQVDLDSGHRRAGLLVVPAEPATDNGPCALALIGDVSRWKASARATLKAVATVVATRLASRPEPVRHGPGTLSPARDDSLVIALVAGAPDAIVAVDSARRIREFNPAAEELFGRARADVLGLDMPETLVPDEFRHQFVDAMAGYLATGDPSEFSVPVRLRALRADGTERPIELTPMPVTVGGEVYFFGFMHDATDLANATFSVVEGDARFRLLSELAPVGIVQTDVDGVCRFVNDRWTQLTQIPASEVIGRNWRSTVNPEDVARIDALRDESGVAQELAADCRLQTAAGAELWVHAVVRRVEDEQGNLVGRVAALTDVSDRRREEQAKDKDRRELAQQNVQLRGLNQTTAHYLAEASRELRTPLTAIISASELIRSASPGMVPAAGRHLDSIQRDAEGLLRVVGDLLDLSNLEEGLAQLELTPVSVPDVAGESVRGLSGTAPEGIALDISVQDGPQVQADSGRLRQALDHLIDNAVKFSEAGGRVEVRARHDGREWRIDVSDSGIGIPPSEVDRLFDRFFRASNARQAGIPGTGLGLPMAKIITELHGGRIEVASSVGQGSTFTVHLPSAP